MLFHGFLCCACAVHAADPVPVVSGLQPQLLTVPPGFNISVYSDGVPKARTMSATVVNGSTIVYVGGKEPNRGKPGGKVSLSSSERYYVVCSTGSGRLQQARVLYFSPCGTSIHVACVGLAYPKRGSPL
jgi:hypothetical protein